jgi:hypothetical protein
MPADWNTFISKVSQKIESHTIKSSDDMADVLTDEYMSAIVGKAQSPYGNLHQKGDRTILNKTLKKGFKILESERSPTLDEKTKDPRYADLEEPMPNTDPQSSTDQIELDFLAWAEDEKNAIADFRFSQFFSEYPNVPKKEKIVVTEIARKLLHQFDGTSSYIQWLYSLRYGDYSDWGILILDEIQILLKNTISKDFVVGEYVRGYAKYTNISNSQISKSVSETNIDTTIGVKKFNNLIEGKLVSIVNSGNSNKYFVSYFDKKHKKTLIKEITDTSIQKKIRFVDVANNIQSIIISKKVIQEEYICDPIRIPKYLTRDFIIHFTYVPEYNRIDATNDKLKKLLKDEYASEDAILDVLDDTNKIYANKGILLSDRNIKRLKINKYDTEHTRYRELRMRWINEMAEGYKKTEGAQKDPDGYFVMAGGIIDYWKSTIIQPLSSTPPVYPCIITLPQMGIYTPIYYGSQARLGDYLRRSFNSGKRFKSPVEIKIAAKIVASALAFSFAMHLLELKFIYKGGIPTSGGPVPMIGFIPLVY